MANLRQVVEPAFLLLPCYLTKTKSPWAPLLFLAPSFPCTSPRFSHPHSSASASVKCQVLEAKGLTPTSLSPPSSSFFSVVHTPLTFSSLSLVLATSLPSHHGPASREPLQSFLATLVNRRGGFLQGHSRHPTNRFLS